jgi:gliding motility-associated-like protein
MNSRLKILKISYLAALFLLVGTTLKAQITVNVAVTDPSCFNYTNGMATANATGGTAPYSYSWSNGQGGGQTVLGIRAGNYTVTVTDASGTRTTKDFVAGQPTQLVGAASPVGGVCLAGLMTYQGSATGSKPPYTYAWRNLATNETINGAVLNAPTAGSYHLSVTDVQSCQVTKVVNIMGDIDVTVRTQAVSCGAFKNGTAEARVSGGLPPYTYRWNYQDATTATLVPVPGGTYIVTVTDANGCQKSAVGTVIEPPTLEPNLIVTGVCSNDASAKVVPTGGTPPFDIKWSNGGIGNRQTNLTVGIYYVTVTDAAGCNKSSEFKVSKQSGVQITTSKYDASCLGVNTGFVSAKTTGDGLGTYVFKWSNGVTSSSPPTVSEIGNLAAGTYSVTATDGAGCKDEATVVVNALRTITFSTTSVAAACGSRNGSITAMNPNGGTAPYTYKWSTGATGTSVSGLAAGAYSVTATDATGCQGIAQATVGNSTITLANRPPTVVNSVCTKPVGKISIVGDFGTAPYNYKLGTKSNATGVFDSLYPGKYIISITDAGGCTYKTDSVTVEDKGLVQARFAIRQLSCFGDSVTVNFPNNTINGSTYAWSYTGGRTSTAFSLTANFSTSEPDVQLIARSPEGCFDTLALRFPAQALKFTLVDSVATCTNTAVNVAVINTGNPMVPLTYKWTPTASLIGSDSSAAANLRVPTVGSAKVFVTVTNPLGCSKLDSVIVRLVDKNARIAYTIAQECNSRTLYFTNVIGAENYIWVYGNPRSPIATKDSSVFKYTFPRAGLDSVYLVPKLACLDTVKVVFTVLDGSAVTVVADKVATVCSADKLTLKATSSTNNFEWSNNKSFTTILGTGATLLVTPTNRSNVFYVRSKNAQGCSALDSVVIINAEIKINRALTLDLCNNTAKTLNVTNLTGDPLKVKWTPAGILTSSDTLLSPTLKATANGTLIGVFTNAFGCTLRDTIPFTVRSFKASATASVKTAYLDDVIALNSSPLGAGYAYSWSPPTNISVPSAAATMATAKATTTYIVKVTDPFGCEDTAQVTVTVLTPECAEPFIFIPRAFTPNGDGTNEKMFVRGEYLTEMEFVIYNRWGEQVFFTRDRAEGWDGTFKGSMVCPDVYGYYVKGKCKKGEDFFVKGNITILK